MNMEEKTMMCGKDCPSVVLVTCDKRVGKNSLPCYKLPLLKQRVLKPAVLKQMVP